MTTVLFVRPCHDDVTAYLYHYCNELIKESKQKGHKTLDKPKEKANKTVVTNIINKNNPHLIMFNGHGSPTMICGHQDKIMIEKGKNEGLLKHRIVYSLSCSSAAELGKEVGDTNSTFVGYIDEFALGMDGNSQTSIQRDKRAKLFLDPSNTLMKSLLKGNSAKQAVSKAKDQMRKNISILRTDPFPDAKDYLPYLYNNYLILEIMGDSSKRLR